MPVLARRDNRTLKPDAVRRRVPTSDGKQRPQPRRYFEQRGIHPRGYLAEHCQGGLPLGDALWLGLPILRQLVRTLRVRQSRLRSSFELRRGVRAGVLVLRAETEARTIKSMPQ